MKIALDNSAVVDYTLLQQSAVAAGTTQTVPPEGDLGTTERGKQSTRQSCSLHRGEAVKAQALAVDSQQQAVAVAVAVDQAKGGTMTQQEMDRVTREWRRCRRWHQTVQTLKVVGFFVGFWVLTVLVSLLMQ